MQKATTKTRTIWISRKSVKDTLRMILTIAACGLLYKLSHDIATAQRGYEAIGGEPIFAMLPLVVYYVRKRK